MRSSHTHGHTRTREGWRRGQRRRKAQEPAAHQKPRDSQSSYGACQRWPDIISRLLSSFERAKERERHRAPSHAIIELVLLAARFGPPAPHLRHRRQPGRRSDDPTGEAAPTSYGYSNDTSGVEARVGRRVEAEEPSAAADRSSSLRDRQVEFCTA